jgi:hypothetical protein
MPIYSENGVLHIDVKAYKTLEFCGIHPRDVTDYTMPLKRGETVEIITGPEMHIDNRILSQLKKYWNLNVYILRGWALDEKGLKEELAKPTNERKFHHFILAYSGDGTYCCLQHIHELYDHTSGWRTWENEPIVTQVGEDKFRKLKKNSELVDRTKIIESVGPENFGKIEDGKWMKANSEDLAKLEEGLEKVTLLASCI